jgi:hypothetical protein
MDPSSYFDLYYTEAHWIYRMVLVVGAFTTVDSNCSCNCFYNFANVDQEFYE